MKKLLKYIPFQLAFFLILGILFANRGIAISPKIIKGSILFCFTVLLLLKNKQGFFIAFTWLLFFLFGVSSYQITNQKNRQHHYTKAMQFNTDSCYSVQLFITKKLKSTKKHRRFEAKLRFINTIYATGKIILNVKKADSLSFLLGKELLVKSNFHSVLKPKNPFQFNYKLYLENKHIYHQLYISKTDLVLLKSAGFSLSKTMGKFHQKIKKSFLNKGFNKDELAIASALLLGEKQEISDVVMRNFINAGAVHILAISGLHIGILMLLLQWLFLPVQRLKGGKKIVLILVVFILWLYAVFVGFSASVVRATTMFTAVAIGLFLNRKASVYQSLLMAAFVLLLFNPRYLFEVGFQLSFLAVFFIVWLQPIFYKTVKFKYRIIDKVWQLITVSLAAQVGVLPLTLYYFHQFSGLFLITNILIIPVLGSILFIGLLSVILALFDFLPYFIVFIFQKTIYYLNEVTSWVSSYESFIFSNISITMFQLVLLYCFIILMTFWMKKKSYTLLVSSLGVVLILQIYSIVAKYDLQTTSEWIVFNSYKSSVIGERTGERLGIFTNNLPESSLITDYCRGKRVKDTVSFKHKLIHFYKNKIILLIDEKSTYNYSISPDIILLQNSPKINLERILLKLKPKQIIADGSNYKSYKTLWQAICKKQKTPFFDTSKKGVYVLK